MNFGHYLQGSALTRKASSAYLIKSKNRHRLKQRDICLFISDCFLVAYICTLQMNLGPFSVKLSETKLMRHDAAGSAFNALCDQLLFLLCVETQLVLVNK